MWNFDFKNIMHAHERERLIDSFIDKRVAINRVELFNSRLARINFFPQWDTSARNAEASFVEGS